MIGIFTAQCSVCLSFYSYCDLFLVFIGGRRKYLTVDIKESNCTPPAWPNYPKEICNGVLFLPASGASLPVISSCSLDSGLLSECMCVCVKEWVDRPQECHGKQSSVTLSHACVHLGTVLALWGLSSGRGSHRKALSSWETWIRPAYFLRVF